MLYNSWRIKLKRDNDERKRLGGSLVGIGEIDLALKYYKNKVSLDRELGNGKGNKGISRRIIGDMIYAN